MIESSKNSGASVAAGEAWLEIVRQKAGAVRFGVVQVIIHESRVVQIELTEKIRLGSAPAKGSDETN
jgi:hypothetical protein